MSRKKLYFIILLSCSAGFIYLWTGFAFTCFFKTITGIPCPACGTTRFILGDFTHGNPLGIIVGATMLLPILVIFDHMMTPIKAGCCTSKKASCRMTPPPPLNLTWAISHKFANLMGQKIPVGSCTPTSIQD